MKTYKKSILEYGIVALQSDSIVFESILFRKRGRKFMYKIQKKDNTH